jgi:hypothetical protein
MFNRIRRKIRHVALWTVFKIKQDKYRDITYVLHNECAASQYLIVVFSGFSKMGFPPRYNYMETLKSVDAMQLFILDNTGYNKAGSYYLGENGYFFVPEQICELISNIKQKHCKSKVIACGSSKGGSAAVYYGLKINAEAIIIGAPQYWIGTYLNTDTYKPVLEKMLGTTANEGIARLDDLLKNEIRKQAYKDKKPIFYIHFSPGEHTYREHIADLIAELELNRYTCELDNAYTYEEHSTVGQYFKEYLLKVCASFMNDDVACR